MSMILSKCDHCGYQQEVSTSLQNRRNICNKCGKRYRVTAPKTPNRKQSLNSSRISSNTRRLKSQARTRKQPDNKRKLNQSSIRTQVTNTKPTNSLRSTQRTNMRTTQRTSMRTTQRTRKPPKDNLLWQKILAIVTILIVIAIVPFLFKEQKKVIRKQKEVANKEKSDYQKVDKQEIVDNFNKKRNPDAKKREPEKIKKQNDSPNKVADNLVENESPKEVANNFPKIEKELPLAEKVPKENENKPQKIYDIPESIDTLLENDNFDFAMACLLVSRAAIKQTFDKDVNIQRWLAKIDNLASGIQAKIKDTFSPKQVIDAMNDYLYKIKRYESSQNGWDHSNLYLSLVLEGEQGYCLGFAELWLALAQRIKWKGKPLPFYGVTVPQHIFVRWDDGKTQINVETLHVPRQTNDPKMKLLQMLQMVDVEKIPGQNISNDEYQERYQISEEAVKNKVYLQNLKPKEVIGLIYFNRSYLNRLEVEKLQHSPQRREMIQRMKKDVNMCTKLFPSDLSSLLLQGQTRLLFHADYDKAIENFEKCLKLENDQYTHVLLARAYMGKKEYEKALECIDNAYNATSTEKMSFTLPAAESSIYYAWGKYEKGIEFCEGYMKANNSSSYLYHNLLLLISKAEFYIKLKTYDQAYALIQLVIDTEIKMFDAYTYSRLGIIHAYLGETDQAQKYLDKAIETDKQDSEAYLGRGIVFLQLREYQKAIDAFEEGLSYNAIHSEIPDFLKQAKRLLKRKKRRKDK